MKDKIRSKINALYEPIQENIDYGALDDPVIRH